MVPGMNHNRPTIIAYRPVLSIALLAAAVALGGCSELRQAVGIEKSTPDEFSVRVRAPLSMPRDYGLKAPRPGTAGPRDDRVRDRAKQIVIEADERIPTMKT